MFPTVFSEILQFLGRDDVMRHRVLAVIASEPMLGKVLEGPGRLGEFRNILKNLVEGRMSFDQAVDATERGLSRQASPHRGSNRVFSDGWALRLVWIQLSVAYNQAVLEFIIESGQDMCFVPHSSDERPESRCTQRLAGRNHVPSVLHAGLMAFYRHGEASTGPLIPDHPHCSHVIQPVHVTTPRT